MTAETLVLPSPRRPALKQALARIIGIGWHRDARRPLRDLPLPQSGAPDVATSAPSARSPDPVDLAVLAIEKLAPASLRACSLGVGVRVVVPDEATAAVFRAALAQTSRARSTDRLVHVVVVEDGVAEPTRDLHRRVTSARYD